MTDVQTGQQGTPALPFPPNMTPPAQATQHTQAPAQQAGNTTPAAPFVFSVGGQNVTDPNVVQARINQLEQFATETRKAGREAFVNGLVAANKITAPQAHGTADQPGMIAFACGLSDEQFTQWSGMWSVAPVQPVLGLHGGTAASANPTNHAQAGTSPEEQKIADAEQIVGMHERGGAMTADQIKGTASYKILVAAGKRTA